MAYMIINGERFEVHKPRKNKLALDEIMERLHRTYSDTTVYDCYERPSEAKVNIYKEWKQWADNTPNVLYFEVSSYNCMQFTLSALYHDVENEAWFSLYITREHNTATYIEL